MEQEELIKVDSLALSYENMTVIKDLSFDVKPGDYLCIVGENGSGKSTLVKSLLSLKKPVGGTISFGGGLRRSEIGYLPQQTGAQQDFPASVWEVVISGCLNRMGLRPFYTDRERKLAAENMERLGITNLKSAATGNYPAVSSREFFWRGRCAQPRSCCCLTSRFPDWTRW